MRTRARTKPIGVISTVAAVAAVLALAHGPSAAANPIEASGAAIAAASSSAPAPAAARRRPRVLCWTKKSRRSDRLMAQRRPKRCGLVSRHSSRPAVRLIKLRWKRWAARGGRATGVAAGRTRRTRFRVTLRRPVRGCRGRVFSRAVLRNRSGTRRLALHTRCAIDGGQQDKPGGVEQPGGGPCVEKNEDLPDDDEDGAPSLSPALYAVTFTLDASLDGIDADGNLPLAIDAVCGVPADLASDGAKLVQRSGLALPSDNTEIWTCAGSTEDEDPESENAVECKDIPEKGGTLLHGEQAMTTLDNDADTAFVGVRLVPRAAWRQDEDGEPVPTFDAYWVKITD
jgi:hypothetical protein